MSSSFIATLVSRDDVNIKLIEIHRKVLFYSTAIDVPTHASCLITEFFLSFFLNKCIAQQMHIHKPVNN